MSENTVEKQTPAHLFKPGQSGNPKGRPKGARNKLGEAFLTAMLEDFEEHGVTTIRSVRCSNPDTYLKIIAAHILPKQAELTINDYEDLTVEQARTALGAVLRDLGTFGVNLGIDFSQGNTDQDQARQPEPVQTLQ